VRTEAWQREDTAQKAIYWGIASTIKGREDLPLKDSGNTDILVHAGKAVASWYMSGALYLLDPVTLETLGHARRLGRKSGYACLVDHHPARRRSLRRTTPSPKMMVTS